MIDTPKKLEVHLKIMKKKLFEAGCNQYQLYPVFCLYYEKNKEKYQLSKWDVLNMACEILIEEECE